MKKSVIVLFMILSIVILSSTFIISQETDEKPESTTAEPETDTNKKPPDAKVTVKEELEKLKKDIKIPKLDLSKPVVVPEYLQLPARIIFGIKEQIPIDLFIILIGVWFVLFLLVAEILKFMPFFKGWTVWGVAFVLTSLGGMSGAIRSFAVFIFGLSSFLERWPALSALAIIFAIVLIAIIGFVLKIVLESLRNNLKLEEAEEEGEKITKLKNIANIEAEFIDKLSK